MAWRSQRWLKMEDSGKPDLPALCPDTSRKIRVARVLCIFFVVYTHTYIGDAEAIGEGLSVGAVVTALKFLLDDGVAKVGVPLLALISGYLALDTQARTETYGRLIGKKARSLIAPMAAWSAIFLGAIMAVGLASGDMVFVSEEMPGTLMGWVNALLAVTTAPTNGPLHYLRDIFLCFLLLPVFRLLLVGAPRTVAGVALVIFLTNGRLFGLVDEPVVPVFFRPMVPGLFVLGMALRLRCVPLPAVDWRRVALPALAALAALVLVPLYRGESDPATNQIALLPAVRLAGVVLVWALAEGVANGWMGRRIVRLEGYAFFAFCTHTITLFLASTVLGKAYGWSFPPVLASTYFFLAPVMCFGVAIIVQRGLASVLPETTRLLAGGRGTPRARRRPAAHVVSGLESEPLAPLPSASRAEPR